MPEIVEVRLKNADRLHLSGQHHEALEICNGVVAEFPDNYLGYEQRSVVFRSLGDLRRAISDISTVVDLLPSSASPRFRRARFLIEQGDCEAAIEDLSRAVELDNGYFGETLLFYRAEAKLRIFDFMGALTDAGKIDAAYCERYFFGHASRTPADIISAAELGMRGFQRH